MASVFDTSPKQKDYSALKKFHPPTVSLSALTFFSLSLSLSLSSLRSCLSFNPFSVSSSIHCHSSSVPIHTWPNPSPPPVMLAAMAFSSSHSLSHPGFSVFSFSQAQRWPSFCFHSHLSPLAVPLIGVTTTGGRRDVLSGIDYLHRVKRRCHGKLSETNIVIVNGRAKITGMVNDISKTYLDDYSDYKHLAAIVRRSFNTEQHDIPTELKLFLTYISKTEPSRLVNIENHPIFLSPLQRLSYRVIAQTFLYFGKSKRSFALALNEKLGKCEWKLNVRTTPMLLLWFKL